MRRENGVDAGIWDCEEDMFASFVREVMPYDAYSLSSAPSPP